MFGLRAVLDQSDGIGGRDVEMGRDFHTLHLCGADEVAGVDDADIGFAQLEFAENAAYVRFLRHDIGLKSVTEGGAEPLVFSGIGQKAAGIPPDGNSFGADDDFMAGLRQLQHGFDCGCLACVPERCGKPSIPDQQPIAGERFHASLLNPSGFNRRLHLRLVG